MTEMEVFETEDKIEFGIAIRRIDGRPFSRRPWQQLLDAVIDAAFEEGEYLVPIQRVDLDS